MRTPGGFRAFAFLPCVAMCVVIVQGAAAKPIDAHWTADFVDSVGINTHFADPSTGYPKLLPILLQRMQEAHLRHLRDGGLDDAGHVTGGDNAADFRTLGRAGLRVDFIVRAGVTADFVRSFPQRVTPALEAFELPNEVNAGATDGAWAANLRHWSARFRTLVNQGAIPYPIIGPSLTVMNLVNPYGLLGDVSADIDFGNVHDYTGERAPDTSGWGGPGESPCEATRYASLPFARCYARAAFARRPLMSTESGWGTDSTRPGNVPEDVQAAYVVRTVLLHFAAGFARTYLYELKETGTDEFAHYGLLRRDGSPKPAFVALGALLRHLDGRRPQGSAGAADVTVVAGAHDELPHLLLRQADGRFVLIIWSNTALSAPSPEATTIADGITHAIVYVSEVAGTPRACAILGTDCSPVNMLPTGDGHGWSVAVNAFGPTLVEFAVAATAPKLTASP